MHRRAQGPEELVFKCLLHDHIFLRSTALLWVLWGLFKLKNKNENALTIRIGYSDMKIRPSVILPERKQFCVSRLPMSGMKSWYLESDGPPLLAGARLAISVQVTESPVSKLVRPRLHLRSKISPRPPSGFCHHYPPTPILKVSVLEGQPWQRRPPRGQLLKELLFFPPFM